MTEREAMVAAIGERETLVADVYDGLREGREPPDAMALARRVRAALEAEEARTMERLAQVFDALESTCPSHPVSWAEVAGHLRALAEKPQAGPRCRYCKEPVEQEGQVHAGGCGNFG